MMTALMWAAFHGKSNHIKVLLEKGADPSISDVDGMTAVHWSVQRHDTRALQVNQCYNNSTGRLGSFSFINLSNPAGTDQPRQCSV
jgi:ankyrin repeat protein